MICITKFLYWNVHWTTLLRSLANRISVCPYGRLWLSSVVQVFMWPICIILYLARIKRLQQQKAKATKQSMRWKLRGNIHLQKQVHTLGKSTGKHSINLFASRSRSYTFETCSCCCFVEDFCQSLKHNLVLQHLFGSHCTKPRDPET